MKLRVYLDTSVFSAYHDGRVPERQRETQEFWPRLDGFLASTSELARQELSQATDEALRPKLLQLLGQVVVHPLTEEMTVIARRYVEHGIFSPVMLNDAIHVAAAVVSDQDVLLSWNFRHLVNRRRRAEINALNASSGLRTLEILAPSEM